MQIFLDSANFEEIEQAAATGLIDGITTNPTLVASIGGSFTDLIARICAIVPGPISAEVLATDTQTMIAEGKKLAKIAENVVVKVPLTPDGLKACAALSDENIMTNVTLCFSPLQALLAAKAGATFISPFVGRLDDIGNHGMSLVSDILDLYDNYPHFETRVLAASIRHPEHVLEAALAGADAATMPAKVFWQMYNHPLTTNGLDTFLKDAAKGGVKV